MLETARKPLRITSNARAKSRHAKRRAKDTYYCQSHSGRRYTYIPVGIPSLPIHQTFPKLRHRELIMPRPKIDIDLENMQAILDSQAGHFTGNQSEYFNMCCKLYNEKYNPPKPIYAQLVYTRVHKTKELKVRFDISHKVYSRKGKILSDEHKQKMQEGRKPKNKIQDPRIEEALRKRFPDKPLLVEGVLRGRKLAIAKAKCLDCCCDDKKSIRLCQSFDCSLYSIRPYQADGV